MSIFCKCSLPDRFVYLRIFFYFNEFPVSIQLTSKDMSFLSVLRLSMIIKCWKLFFVKRSHIVDAFCNKLSSLIYITIPFRFTLHIVFSTSLYYCVFCLILFVCYIQSFKKNLLEFVCCICHFSLLSYLLVVTRHCFLLVAPLVQYQTFSFV